MSKIVLGRDRMDQGKDAYPLTVDIADEKRQALAYNMLYHMMENGAEITVNGKQVPLDKDMLYIRRETATSKCYTKLHLDPEWYSANRENFEKGAEQYTTACMGEDGKLILFAPLTSSYEKANEMNNFMLLGFDPSVSISCSQDGEMKPVIVNGHPTQEGIVNEQGQLITERFDRDWAQGISSEMTNPLEDTGMKIKLAGKEFPAEDVLKVCERFEDAKALYITEFQGSEKTILKSLVWENYLRVDPNLRMGNQNLDLVKTVPSRFGDFKRQLTDKVLNAVDRKEHFHAQRMPDLGDALANLQSEIETNGITM